MRLLVVKNHIITADVFVAESFFQRFLGYMFRKKPHHDVILFRPCNSIHTFFMKFNIDVLFLNQDMKVIYKIQGLKPRKVVMPVPEACMVIESREGEFYDIKIGDVLDCCFYE